MFVLIRKAKALPAFCNSFKVTKKWKEIMIYVSQESYKNLFVSLYQLCQLFW